VANQRNETQGTKKPEVEVLGINLVNLSRFLKRCDMTPTQHLISSKIHCHTFWHPKLRQ